MERDFDGLITPDCYFLFKKKPQNTNAIFILTIDVIE